LKIVNINLSENILVWTPAKTGSVTASKILDKLGFNSFLLDNDKLKSSSKFQHNNHCFHFDNIEKYKLLVTLRNPYEQLVSFFKMSVGNFRAQSENGIVDRFIKSDEINKDDFKSMIIQLFNNTKSDNCCFCFGKIVPDYIIRLEKMYEDYLKIPFVTNTEYYKSGELLNDCQTKSNESVYEYFDFRELYNEEIADMVYYNFVRVFELGGYDKNSWKK